MADVLKKLRNIRTPLTGYINHPTEVLAETDGDSPGPSSSVDTQPQMGEDARKRRQEAGKNWRVKP